MTNQLSLAQSFYLLQQKPKNVSRFITPTNSEMYIFGAVLLELRTLNKIKILDFKKVSLVDNQKTGVQYLDSVIDFIQKNNNLNIYDLLYRYTYNQYDKAKNQITESLKEFENSSLLDNVVEGLRAELLEPGEVTETNKALILLLNTSNYDVKLSKRFFSEYESQILEKKVGEIKSKQDELTKDFVFITSKYQGGLKDFYYSFLPSINPLNLRRLHPKYIRILLTTGIFGFISGLLVVAVVYYILTV